jgi:hypothetical protein
VSNALIRFTAQPEPGLQMVAKWEDGSSGFPTATTLASILVEGVDRVEDRLREAAGLIDDHEHIAGVNALERGLVIVGRLAAVSNEFLADVPLGVERDPPGQLCLPMRRADVPPEDRFNLCRRRRGRDHKRFAGRMHVDPRAGRHLTYTAPRACTWAPWETL